jgi:hypothetical protein
MRRRGGSATAGEAGLLRTHRPATFRQKRPCPPPRRFRETSDSEPKLLPDGRSGAPRSTGSILMENTISSTQGPHSHTVLLKPRSSAGLLPATRLHLALRSCGARQDTYPRGHTIPTGAVPGLVRGLGYTAPTYLRRRPGSPSNGHRGPALFVSRLIAQTNDHPPRRRQGRLAQGSLGAARRA